MPDLSGKMSVNELIWRSKAMAERLLADPDVSDEIKASARKVIAVHEREERRGMHDHLPNEDIDA